jgi:hypothetical protein
VASEARGNMPESRPEADAETVLTRRVEGAATLTARGAGVGHTSTYSEFFNVRGK